MAKILIVDDNPLFRESLRDTLHTRFPSSEITEANDGEEALIEVEAHNLDLIFMDINLPGENGLEVAARVKARYPDIVIVVVTNYDPAEYRDAALRNGANYFLSKDSPTNDLLALVQTILFD